jgi:hypothetical protein
MSGLYGWRSNVASRYQGGDILEVQYDTANLIQASCEFFAPVGLLRRVTEVDFISEVDPPA